jgi:hypothetical protein
MNEEDIDKEIVELERLIADPDLGRGTAHTMARVSGYCRAIDNFCVGKSQEFKERKTYVV